MFPDELATVQKCVLYVTRMKCVPQTTDRFNSVIELSVIELYQIIQHNFSVKFISISLKVRSWIKVRNDQLVSTRMLPVIVVINIFHSVSYAISSFDYELHQLLPFFRLIVLVHPDSSQIQRERWVTRLSMLLIHLFLSIFLHNFCVQVFLRLPAKMWKRSVMLHPCLLVCCKSLSPKFVLQSL